MKNLARAFHPRIITDSVKAVIRKKIKAKLLEQENAIPKVPLQRKHVRHCQTVLNREELLERLPKGGTVGEIGVSCGDFSEQIIRVSRPSKLHLIDSWDSERYHSHLLQVRERLSSELERKQVEIHQKLSLDAVVDFKDQYFDWIFVDTDHSYELTARELEVYECKVKPGGIIAGHDYVMGNWSNSFRYGVIEAVHEFCVKRNWELIWLTIDPIEFNSFAIRRIQE